MKRFTLLGVVFLVLAGLGQAKQKGSADTDAKEKEVVKAVMPSGTDGEGTLSLGYDTTSVQVVKVDTFTQITINGITGTFSQIKVGMQVSTMGLDGDSLTSIDLVGTGKEKGSGKGKKHKKQQQTE
jgi:hypothetical protein